MWWKQRLLHKKQWYLYQNLTEMSGNDILKNCRKSFKGYMRKQLHKGKRFCRNWCSKFGCGVIFGGGVFGLITPLRYNTHPRCTLRYDTHPLRTPQVWHSPTPYPLGMTLTHSVPLRYDTHPQFPQVWHSPTLYPSGMTLTHVIPLTYDTHAIPLRYDTQAVTLRYDTHPCCTPQVWHSITPYPSGMTLTHSVPLRYDTHLHHTP